MAETYVPLVRWCCNQCSHSGEVENPQGAEFWVLCERISNAHRDRSTACHSDHRIDYVWVALLPLLRGLTLDKVLDYRKGEAHANPT